MIRYQDIEVTPKDIKECKKEYLEKRKYIGTDKPVILDDKMAEYVMRSRKYHEMWMNSPHKSHILTEWESQIMAPAGTPRFYTYRECKICGASQYYHAAGKFIDSELDRKCISR